MEILYPGYKAYFHRFRTEPFHTEYTTKYCNSTDPVLYRQVPKYSWSEPRRPTAAVRCELDTGTRLTYLRPPFAARMTSYTTEQEAERYHKLKPTSVWDADAVLDHGQGSSDRSTSFVRKRSSPKLPDLFSKLITPSGRDKGSPNENLADDQGSQRRGKSSARAPRKEMASSGQVRFKTTSHAYPSSSSQANSVVTSQSPSRIAKSLHVAHLHKLPEVSKNASDLHRVRVSQLGQRDEQILGRVAPRPSTLLSKHPKPVRYIRDTCFFHPTQERKKHYYIVNPNWYSEQRVTIPKNNVFS